MDVNVNREGRKDLWGSSHSLFFQVSFFLRRGLSTSRVLHVEHSSFWYRNLDTSENRPDIHAKCLNVVLNKNEEDQTVDLLCEKYRNIS